MDNDLICRLAKERASLASQLGVLDRELGSAVASTDSWTPEMVESLAGINGIPGSLSISDIVPGEELILLDPDEMHMEVRKIVGVDNHFRVNTVRAWSPGAIIQYDLASLGVVPNVNGEWFNEFVTFPDNPLNLEQALDWLDGMGEDPGVEDLISFVESRLMTKHGVQIDSDENGSLVKVISGMLNHRDPGDDLLL